jgi:hypothetical protein
VGSSQHWVVAGQGIVKSLAEPGSNATGLTLFEFSIGGKWLELIKEIAPSVRRTAVMFKLQPQTDAAGVYFSTNPPICQQRDKASPKGRSSRNHLAPAAAA